MYTPNGARDFLRLGLIAASLAVAVAVATPVVAAQLPLPAIVEPAIKESHVGKVIFVELVTPDLAAAKRFYGGLFGWTFRDLDTGGTGYAEAMLNGEPVAGISRRKCLWVTIGNLRG